MNPYIICLEERRLAIPPVTVPLSDKRLLSVDEFQAYCGLGHNSSLKLATKAKCRICQGRRLLIDRIKFDEWCAEHEQKLFLTYAKDSCFYPSYELALSTGMRNGELRGLQWTDVDFSTKIIHTLIYWNKQYFFDSPKTASSERDIPMLNNVYALLKQQQQLQRKKQLAMGELWLPPAGFENLVFTNQKSALVNRNRFKISKCGNPL